MTPVRIAISRSKTTNPMKNEVNQEHLYTVGRNAK
jgi:hypothetical protein